MTSDRIRRILGIALPFAQIVPPVLPLLGIGSSVGVMSAASQTPAIPAGYAFPTMWTLLFLLSIVFGIWQSLPAQRGAVLPRQVGWPLIGVFAANTLWQLMAIFSAANGFHLVAVILAGLFCALAAHILAQRDDATGFGARWIVLPLTGLMAGWLSAATFANISGAARATGMVQADGFAATLAACLVLLAAGGFAAAVAWLSPRRGWYAGGVGWALLGVTAANLGINQFDLPAAVAAGAMLALVVAVVWARRGMSAPAEPVGSG